MSALLIVFLLVDYAEIGKVYRFQYSSQVVLVSYLLRGIQRIIRICLAGENKKTGRYPLARLFLVYGSTMANGDIQAITYEIRSPVLFPWQPPGCDS
jgi:hypothetical protein